MSWVPHKPLEVLPAVSVFQGKIAVFRDGDRIWAVDNACPHLGYPLSQGERCGGELTCNWHNYRFELDSGRCVKGDEDLRTHPVRVRDGVVEIQVEAPSWSFDALDAAVLSGDFGRCARELLRARAAGVEDSAIALRIARLDCVHGEWGPGHALALAAEAERVGPDGLAMALQMACESLIRLPARPRLEPREGDLGAALEAGRAEEAEAIARALEPEAARLEMIRHCGNHFLDYGHGLIFVVLAGRLLDPDVMGGLAFGLANGTREEKLPAWTGFRKRTQGLDLGWLHQRQMNGPKGWWDRESLHTAVLDGPPGDGLDRVIKALEEGVPQQEILDVLSPAAAERLWRYDLGLEVDPESQDRWLDVTHVLTFAAAVRPVLELDEPAGVGLLLQLAFFIRRLKPLDGPPAALPPVHDERAMAAVLRTRLDQAWASRPIFTAHRAKTTLAALDEWEALRGEPRAEMALLAARRFLDSPLNEVRGPQVLAAARAVVEQGRPPRSRLPG